MVGIHQLPGIVLRPKYEAQTKQPAETGRSIEHEAATSQPLPAVPRPYFASQPPTVKFCGLLNEDYHAEMRINEAINPTSVSALKRALLLRNMVKKAKGDTSTLKLFLDAGNAEGHRNVSRAALADMFRFIDRKVDVIVKENLDQYGMMALLSTTGKRFMYDGARLSLGPIQDGASYMRNDDHQIRREWNIEYTRDLEYLLMSRTGVTDRSKVFWDDLSSARDYNALQALHYGTKGLVDAVIVGFDQVVTREDLEKFVKKRKMSGEKLKEFLSDSHNIKKIPSRNLKDYAPESIPSATKNPKIKDLSVYVSPKEQATPAPTPAPAAATAGTAKPAEEEDKTLTLYVPGDKGSFVKTAADKLPLGNRVKNKDLKAGRLFVDHLSSPRSIIEDDVIFFNDGFADETAEQVTDALVSLDKKKRDQKDPSHIKIVVNSPGGSISSGLDIRSTIAQAKTPVDIIVNGMAASCGAFLVSSATGNRFATPNARIMIHDAWWSRPLETTRNYNENMDGLDQVTQLFVKAIAMASGRPFKAVWQDMKVDVWLNPLEAMFYGSNGLVDGILVGENKVITRQNILDHLNASPYLAEKYGTATPAEAYLKDRMKTLREGKRQWKPEEHNNSDPFENPLETIETVATKASKPLNEVTDLAGSVPRPENPIDYMIVHPA